jgi:nucleoside-diphosphate-sugar epimerase
MQRIAITGANGFIGIHLVRGAAAAGREVLGVVRSPAAAARVREAGARPLEIVGWDPEALARALEGCSAVVHLAQIGAERGGQSYEATNVSFTERVLEDARRARVPRFVLFSGLGVARYGMNRRCTNGYFLSKLEAEAALFRSGLEAVVFRPSYVIGPGDAFVASTLRSMGAGPVEVPGDGAYRMQPVAVADAVALVLASLDRPSCGIPTVLDLVGPEVVAYTTLLERLARVAGACGRALGLRLRSVPVAEADERARAGGYQGLLPDELDCLLCDETGDSRPLQELLGRPLAPLDEALAVAVRAA